MMYKYSMLIFSIWLILSTSSAFGKVYEASAEMREAICKDFQKLINYHYLTPSDSIAFVQQRIEQLQARQELNIPTEFTIPMELVAFRPEGKRSYIIKYSSERELGIGYIPSDLVSYYEQEAWKAFNEFEQDAPTLSIVLAQQFTESHFDPFIIGDKGESIGLPQLYRKTAIWLYKQDSVLWADNFTLDDKRKHSFNDIRSMVRFPFLFLPKYKRYSSLKKFEGLRRYNGMGEKAEKYAQLILSRSLFYEEWINQYREVNVSATQFQKLLFDAIDAQLFSKQMPALEERKKEELFEWASLDFINPNTRLHKEVSISLERYFEQEIKVEKNRNYTTVEDGLEHYIKIEDGRTLYSYFKDVKNLIEVVNHPKNTHTYCYTKHGRKRAKIRTIKDIQGKDFYTNAKVGDWIYIPPGITLYSPKTDLLIVARR